MSSESLITWWKVSFPESTRSIEWTARSNRRTSLICDWQYIISVAKSSRETPEMHIVRILRIIVTFWAAYRLLTGLRSFSLNWPPPIYGDGICFANVPFLESIFRRHLWTDLYETLTLDVYRSAIEYCEEILGIDPKQIWGLKSYTCFRRLRNSVATLRACTPISGSEHDIDNREMRWKLQRVPYIVS